MMVSIKQCRDCKRQLPVTDFAKRKASPDGLQIYCRACKAQRHREWSDSDPAHVYEVFRNNRSIGVARHGKEWLRGVAKPYLEQPRALRREIFRLAVKVMTAAREQQGLPPILLDRKAPPGFHACRVCGGILANDYGSGGRGCWACSQPVYNPTRRARAQRNDDDQERMAQ
jgi:hypothetical protein